MRRTTIRLCHVSLSTRQYSSTSPPPPASAAPPPLIRVSNHVAKLGPPKAGPKPRQLLSLPPFPAGRHLPGKKSYHDGAVSHVTAVSWLRYYFHEIDDAAIRSHFNKGLVQMECESSIGKHMRKIRPSEVMEEGARVYVAVSIAESKVSRRFDCIPSETLYPNADEIDYLQRLVKYKDSAIIVLNKPPKLPVKGNVPVHNSMDALAAAALSYDYDEGPKLVHRLDRESSGILLMGRTKESLYLLQSLYTDINVGKSSCRAWNDACRAKCQRYWALVIGSPKEKEGLICAPLTKVLLDDGKTERVILAHQSGLEASQPALTQYRVLGPTINGCSWIELQPLTSRKHQLRVHCAEALGTPIVGDYKYGWFVHRRWKQMPHIDIEPATGLQYKLRRPAGLDVQKGSVVSKVPLLHLHCRELVLPNIAKFLCLLDQKLDNRYTVDSSKPDVLRFVASMPTHMKISWNLMSSYLV
ncbi:PREDICTED: RNA pseudouridine synthase 3, mitochondrial [Fragaria vesca subsp. vesca]|uniref:RNA pseudouridine synthase 3, mitochondrial n=1 Tax=Fragaria vesca subsp. vesca TaxID=101020 RepID=UPI0002C35F04|nr:PREDICTED: RNA pseudouridine synthase 3, mitochondrial [Fragaria vesca subsp. vesca]